MERGKGWVHEVRGNILRMKLSNLIDEGNQQSLGEIAAASGLGAKSFRVRDSGP